ncbi:hypothetical protein M407DRAFT_96474 [Tulasnella calospora MUT 4182]|uniref:Uncharacterized protein n=1 Tax=Tulasnella calospora MUT 4182 TaxID=1051891 RepID=A0A0C3MGQ4_9AGAM|nr:hypothetical protein M407DRAFT_96474 [Tulasnella calospora MUT 4182]
MVAAKKAEEGRKPEKAQAEGEATKISDADEVTTVNEPAEGTPAETDRPAVHFAVEAGEAPSQSQPDFSVEVMPFKQKDPPIQIERSTPGKATEAVIHPPGSESTARKSTSPPAEAPEPKAKKSKVATKSSPTKATRSESPPPASNSSERRVTRASAKAAAEADLSPSDGATPSARKTRSKSPAKKTSTSATRSRRKAAPDPLSTTSAPGTSKTKRKRASSPKPPPSPASPRKASGSSKDAGPDASPLPERRSKRARGAKAASKR